MRKQDSRRSPPRLQQPPRPAAPAHRGPHRPEPRSGHPQRPVALATRGETYRYPMQALDPDGDPLANRVVSGPSGLAIDAAGLVTWPEPVEGVYPLILRVEDGQAIAEQRVGWVERSETHR